MREPELPTFIRESLAEDGSEAPSDEELLRSLDGLAEALPAVALPPGSLERLLGEVEKWPMRYAPFYARLAELLDLDEAGVEKILTVAAASRVWRWGGLPGIRTLDVTGGPRIAGATAVLIRFEAGVRLPQHRHQAEERVLILEGGYRDYDGKAHEAGELHQMAAGTSHGFVIFPDEPCVALAVYRGELEFASWPLRLLAKIMGR